MRGWRCARGRPGWRAADVDAAIDAGEVVVSWLCRGTLHMVHRDDYAWLHALTAAPGGRTTGAGSAQEGVKDPERAVKVVVKALAGRSDAAQRAGRTVAAAGIQARARRWSTSC